MCIRDSIAAYAPLITAQLVDRFQTCRTLIRNCLLYTSPVTVGSGRAASRALSLQGVWGISLEVKDTFYIFIRLFCEFILTPVSYTHLDVYKRQPPS